MQPSKEYVAIDLHRHRSVIVRRSSEGETIESTRVDNGDLQAFESAVMAAGEHPEVVIEATYGWVRHEAPLDRVGCKDPPAGCRSSPLKLEAA